MRTIALTVMVSAVFLTSQVALAQQGGIEALAQSGVEGSVVVADLVKFNSGGAERYAIYDQVAEAKLKDLGGEVIFRGEAARVANPFPSDEWDLVTFRKYPSVAAVMAMASSEEYQGAFPHRLASVERSFAYAFSGELPSLAGPNPGRHPMNVVPAPATSDAVYMLNLLRFKPDGGELNYFAQYGARVSGMGPTPVLVLKGIAAIIGEEVVDRLILAHYPSAEVFTDMIASPEYRAVAPRRTEAIELGLVLPFSMVVEK